MLYVLLILLLSTHAGVTTAQVLPNIGYIFRGYHIYHGNPLATQVASDPGFQSLIFEPNYTQNLTSSDLKYQVPDGVNAYFKEGCTQAFSSDVIETSQEYQALLKDMVRTNYTGFDHSFKGSTDYRDVSETHDADTTSQLLLTQILCTKYEVVLNSASPPPLNLMFVDAARGLIGTYNKDRKDTEQINSAIHGFFNRYGTHYVSKIDMGSRFSFQSTLNSLDRHELGQLGLDMQAGAVFSMTRKMGHKLSEEEVRKSHLFDDLIPNPKSSSSFAHDADGSMDIAGSKPVPLYYEIQRIDALFVKRFMKTASVDYKQIQILIAAYFEDYCENEKKYSGEDRCIVETDAATKPSSSERNFKVVFPDAGLSSSSNSILWRKKLAPLKAFTISWWMKTTLYKYTGQTSKRRVVVSYNNNAQYNGRGHFKIMTSPESEGGCLSIQLNGVLIETPRSCLIPVDNNYHHYVFTWSSNYGRWQLYTDGNIMSGGSTGRGFVTPEGGYFVIGQEHNTGSIHKDPLSAFVGEIAYLNVWNFNVNGVEARRLAFDNSFVVGNVVAWEQEKLKFNGENLHVTPVTSNEEFFKA